MSDTAQAPAEFIDEAEDRAPEPIKALGPDHPEPEIIEPQRNGLKASAALVPVGPHGAAPITLENQLTLAQYMAKAIASVPKHFHGNVGDCLALIDMASRANLSPYMLAAKTYVEPRSGRMSFESQAYHALLIGSGWLKDSALHVKYDGEGDARTCTVWGTLRGEAEPRYHTSSPLGTLRPKRNDEGKVKGSPLWEKKPDVQMFYDTSRDWSRIFSPIATLGMLDAYETIETPIGGHIDDAKGDGLMQRLAGTDRTEGHQNGHTETELAKVAADATATIKPAEPAKAVAASAPGKPPAKAAGKKESAKARKAAAKPDAAAKPEPKQETDTPAPVPTEPRNAAEFQVYCIDWIDRSADPEMALERWNAERDMRDTLSVPVKVRNSLRERLETKHGV